MVSNNDLLGDFILNYTVSKNVTNENITGVLYGVYTDFEKSYEQHQGTRPDFTSSYTPEDLPSDHIGFWAAINGKDINEIPVTLEQLGEVSHASTVSLLLNSLGSTKNYELLPMAPQAVQTNRGGAVIQMVNIPWPTWLEIDFIPSSPVTWQRK